MDCAIRGIGGHSVQCPRLLSAAEGDRVGVGRVFPVSRRPERRLEIPEDHAKVLLLSTDDDARTDALACGEALSATLLECTMAGLATSPVTHLTEVAVTRELIKSLMDQDAVPQVLIRVGVVPVTEKAPRATPRRPLSEVLRLQGLTGNGNARFEDTKTLCRRRHRRLSSRNPSPPMGSR